MTSAAGKDLYALMLAWREFQTRVPVQLRTIEDERHYRAMVGFMNKLIDEMGDRKTHPFLGLLDIVTLFVREYEKRNVEIPDAEPAAVVRFLMAERVNHCETPGCAKLASKCC